MLRVTSPAANTTTAMYPESNRIDSSTDDKWASSSSSSTETIPANDQPNDSDFGEDEFLDVEDDLYVE